MTKDWERFINRGATEEQLTKCVLLGFTPGYGTGRDWHTGEPAKWYANIEEPMCPHQIWPEKFECNSPSPCKEIVERTSGSWSCTFKTLEELIEAWLLWKKNKNADG